MGRRGFAVVGLLVAVVSVALGAELAGAGGLALDQADAQARSAQATQDQDGEPTAQEDQDERPAPAGGHEIVPEPNSGRDPEDAGDPGGALQIVLFLAIVGGIAGLVLLVRRDMRRSRSSGVSNGR